MLRTIALIIAFCLCSCATLTPLPPIAVGLLDCGEAALRNAAVDLIPRVTTALASGDYEGELLKLLKETSEAALDCAVAFVGGKSAGAARVAPNDQLTKDMAARAQVWLTKRGAVVKPSGL